MKLPERLRHPALKLYSSPYHLALAHHLRHARGCYSSRDRCSALFLSLPVVRVRLPGPSPTERFEKTPITLSAEIETFEGSPDRKFQIDRLFYHKQGSHKKLVPRIQEDFDKYFDKYFEEELEEHFQKHFQGATQDLDTNDLYILFKGR